jgi:hypothetical protein
MNPAIPETITGGRRVYSDPAVRRNPHRPPTRRGEKVRRPRPKITPARAKIERKKKHGKDQQRERTASITIGASICHPSLPIMRVKSWATHSERKRGQVFASFVCGAIKPEGKHAPGLRQTRRPSLLITYADRLRTRHVLKGRWILESQSARAICILQALHLLGFPSQNRADAKGKKRGSHSPAI